MIALFRSYLGRFRVGLAAAVVAVVLATAGGLAFPALAASGDVSTLAGSGTNGFADGPGSTAQFAYPFGVAADGSGNVYVADTDNNRIRKIDSLGVVSTLAGTGTAGFADGPGATAQFKYPYGVGVDGSGNVYVADTHNQRIRKIDSLGIVSTLAGTGITGFADGPGATAQFKYPHGVVVDGSGNVFVADTINQRIRKIDSLGVVSTLAGTGIAGFAEGPGATAQFDYPQGLAFDGSSNLYVADSYNNRIRKIDSFGVASTLAGSGMMGFADGPSATAQFSNPYGVAMDGSGNIYAVDKNRIRKIDSLGVVSTLAGSDTSGTADGSGAAAQFYYPHGLAVNGSGFVYVADTNNFRIRKIDDTAVIPATTTTTAPTTTTTTSPTTTTTTSPTTTTTTSPTTTTTTSPTTTTTTSPTTTTTSPTTTTTPPTTTTTPTTTTVPSTSIASSLAPIVMVTPFEVPPESTTSTTRVPVAPISSTIPTTIPTAIPTTIPTAASQPTTSQPTSVSLAVSTVNTGGEFTVRGKGYRSGSTAVIELHSDPIRLGTVVIANDGTFTFTTPLPLGIVGQHHIVVQGTDANNQPVTEETPITIAPASANAAEIALTGTPALALAALGVMLIIAGLACLTLYRRTNYDATDSPKPTR
jgi:hypothetical protein